MKKDEGFPWCFSHVSNDILGEEQTSFFITHLLTRHAIEKMKDFHDVEYKCELEVPHYFKK